MQMVIEIDDNLYSQIEYLEPKANTMLDKLMRSIKNGTPLPKGHGDLKDGEKIKNAFIAWSMVMRRNFTDSEIASIVYNSPTFIEADKIESEKE